MDSEEVASTMNMMPEHLKDGAKTKFKQLTGFAQSSAEEIKKISSQAADKVEIMSSEVKTKMIVAKDTLVERVKADRGVTFAKELEKPEMSKPEQPEQPEEVKPPSKLTLWINANGIDFALWLSLAMVVYFAGYFQWSFLYILIPIVSTYLHQNRKEVKKSKLKFSQDVFQLGEEKAIKLRIDETFLPSWFQFPDVERVEWINRIFCILWPHLAVYLENMIRHKIEPQARETLEKYRLWGFKFNSINFGQAPPRLEGLKVYTTPGDNEVVVDLDVKFSSSNDSQISISLLKVGASISDIVFGGQVRVILKPLISELPIVGGLQVFFLKPPTMDFDLGGAAQVLDLPGVNGLLKSAINEAIADNLVNPNRLSIPLTDKISPVDLRMPKPIGVLVVEVIEAKDLPRTDVGFSKCDPYVIISHGRNEKRTSVSSGTNPFWKESLAFAIEIPESELQVLILDRDTMSGDDFVGQTKFNVATLIEAGGVVDTWIGLQTADGSEESQGRIHLKLSWLAITTDIEESKNGSAYSAVLSIYLDSVQTRPIYSDVPEVCVKMSVGKSASESSVVLGRDPVFQEGHVILLKKIEDEMLVFNILDMADDDDKGEEMATFKYPLSKLVQSDDLTLKLQTHELPEWKGRIIFAAQLKYLAKPPNTEGSNAVKQLASGLAGTSKKIAKRTARSVTKNVGSVTKNVGSVTKNVTSATTSVVRTFGTATGGAIRKVSSPFSKTKRGHEGEKEMEAESPVTSSVPALETNFDVDEDSFDDLTTYHISSHATHGSESVTQQQNVNGASPKLTSHSPLEPTRSFDSSSEDNGGSHQSNVRRRLSEGFKSFGFRK